MAKDFSISMPDAAEFRRRLEKKREGIKTEVQKDILTMAKGVRTMLHARTPIAQSYSAIKTVGGGKTQPMTTEGGRAKAAFTNSPREAGDAIFDVRGYTAKIGTNVFYQKFLEEGTRAHGPKHAKFLRFPTLNGVVFTKWVRGIRPMRIFARTKETQSRILPISVRVAVRKGLNH